MDAVFKALSDPQRRAVLDRLFLDDGQTVQRLCDGVPYSRQALSKHLGILEHAGLLVTEFRGREKLHYLNPVPIQDIANRWIDKYAHRRLAAVAALKHALEDKHE